MKALRFWCREPGTRPAARGRPSAPRPVLRGGIWSIRPGGRASPPRSGCPTPARGRGCRGSPAGCCSRVKAWSCVRRPPPSAMRPLSANWNCCECGGNASRRLRTARRPCCGGSPTRWRLSCAIGSSRAARCSRTGHCAATPNASAFPTRKIELLQEPGWRAFGLEDVIGRALEPVVALAGGGSISIETTRAATVIDVDGGGRRDVLALNLEAAGAVAREIRLRGLGGLVADRFCRSRPGGRTPEGGPPPGGRLRG